MPLDLAGPIEVVGRLSEASGIGESARLCVKDLRASGYSVCVRDVDRPQQSVDPEAASARIRVFHLNPPMMPRGILAVGLRSFQQSFNIGFWAWELEVLPREWVQAARYMSAVFAPSAFTARAIRSVCDLPVATVLHPLRDRPAERDVRQQLGIPASAFLVTSVMNLSSSPERKNPLGALRAFLDYSRSDADAWMVLKVSEREEPLALRDIPRGVAGFEKVKIFAERWPADRVSGLISESDVYLSLHRSEGFGLTIAEAILRRVPVIATGWSGNLDFCDPDSTWLVEASRVPVTSHHPELADAGAAYWAEPSCDQAAFFLGCIKLDRTSALNKAQQAESYLKCAMRRATYAAALKGLISQVSE